MSEKIRNANKTVMMNTFFLYVRMVFVIIVNLYISRVILDVLGVEDFGIYNVVGGVVMMFSFLNTAMSVGSQRFLAYDMARDPKNVSATFTSTANVHFFISILIFLLCETIGLWFLNERMVIPAERLDAANWVFHSAVLSFMLMVNSVPYNAFIMASEDMGIFSTISIIDIFLKLGAALSISHLPYDKLKSYAALLFIVSVFVYALYAVVCHVRYKRCRLLFTFDRNMFIKLLSYSSWNLFGGFAKVCINNGTIIIFNLFFGPVVNAARGISYQVSSALSNLTMNVQSAINPAIIKAHATGEKERMTMLIFRGAIYSYFLLYLAVLPLFLSTPYVLGLWLKEIPEYAIDFTRWILIITLVDSLSGTLMSASQASGRIKGYQLTIGLFLLLNLPLSCLALTLHDNPTIVFAIALCISFLALFIRLYLVSKLVSLSITDFTLKILLRIFTITLITFCIAVALQRFLCGGMVGFIQNCLCCCLVCVLSYWFIGLETDEKTFAKKHILRITGLIKLKFNRKSPTK